MEMDKPDFTGKTIGLFGAGDYKSHGEQFVSALGTLYDHFKKLGATLVGEIPTDGYTYEYSLRRFAMVNLLDYLLMKLMKVRKLTSVLQVGLKY